MQFLPDELASRLKAEGKAVEEIFRSYSPEQWQSLVYTSGGPWQVRDVLAHFIAAEKGFQQLIENVSAGGPGAWIDFEIDEYNRRTVAELRGLEPLILLGQFAMLRERTAALVGALAPEQLDRRGRHPFIGEAPLGDIIRAIYHHNSLHMRDVRKVLRVLAQPGPAA